MDTGNVVTGWDYALFTDSGAPVPSFGHRGVIFFARVDVVIWSCVHFHETVGGAIHCATKGYFESRKDMSL